MKEHERGEDTIQTLIRMNKEKYLDMPQMEPGPNLTTPFHIHGPHVLN
jgi:hypothetical protein